MNSKYEAFDRSYLLLKPLSERIDDMNLDYLLPLEGPALDFVHPQLKQVVKRIVAAKGKGSARIIMMRAHVIKKGVSRYFVDLLERSHFTHIAMNGAGAIHDYELARAGATTESVARCIRSSEFGLRREAGELNEVIRGAAAPSLGLG